MKLQCDAKVLKKGGGVSKDTDWEIKARVDLTLYSPAGSAELLLEADSFDDRGNSVLTIQHRTMLCGARIAEQLNELLANVKGDMEPHEFISMVEKVLR